MCVVVVEEGARVCVCVCGVVVEEGEECKFGVCVSKRRRGGTNYAL